MRNAFYLLAFALSLSACSDPKSRETSLTSEEALVAKAREIHDRILTIDTHDDIPSNFATPEEDPGVRNDRQVNIPKMVEGGLDTGFFVVYVGQSERTPENYGKAADEARQKFAAIHRMTEMYPEKIELATSPEDVIRINQGGKLAACIGIENGFVIGKDLSLLKEYHERGARYVTLAHGGHNDIAESATPRSSLGDKEAEHDGLSEFGRQVVEEMNRIGIMVDVSHISKDAMMQAVETSEAPVIASHSGVRSLCNHPRNLDDEQLLAMKKSGSVIQAVALDDFVKEAPEEKKKAIEELRAEMGITGWAAYRNLTEEQRATYQERMEEINSRWPGADVNDYVDHIDYAVRLIGIDHVGISSDFDGGGGVTGWNDASETFNVTLELVRRGYSEEDIEKLWGGNLLRVWRKVESVSSGLQNSE
jgi:membrane dipeptidase